MLKCVVYVCIRVCVYVYSTYIIIIIFNDNKDYVCLRVELPKGRPTNCVRGFLICRFSSSASIWIKILKTIFHFCNRFNFSVMCNCDVFVYYGAHFVCICKIFGTN